MAPLDLRVISSNPALAHRVATALTAVGLAPTPVGRGTTRAVLRYRATPLDPVLQAVLELLRPIPIGIEHAPDLDVDAELLLGAPVGEDLSRDKLRLRCPDPAFARRLANVARKFGFARVDVSAAPDHVPAATLRYGGASAFSRGVAGWLAVQAGCAMPEAIKAWDSSDRDLHFDVPTPGSERLSPRVTIPVTIRADCPTAFAALFPRLREAGFRRVRAATLSPGEGTRLRFDPGGFAACEAHLEIADLTRACAEAFSTLGIDCASYPLEVAERREDATDGATIDIPVAAIVSGQLAPWSRFDPARYSVVLRCDDPPLTRALADGCRAVGFAVEIRGIDTLRDGFLMRYGSKVPTPVRERLRRVVDAQLLPLGGVDFPVPSSKAEGEKIEVQLPVAALRNGKLLAELASPARHMIKVTAPSTAVARLIADALKSWGCPKVKIEVDTDTAPGSIKHGCARPELLDRIDALVTSHFGPVPLAREKAWGDEDHDIFLRLPSHLSLPAEPARPSPAAPPKQVAPPQAAPPVRAAAPARVAFVEETANTLRIADITLPRRQGGPHPLAPRISSFGGFCIDQMVAETLAFAARAVIAGHAAALEGPTAASKTWAVSWLAAVLGVPVYRLNLSGSSDASELIGRYVPDEARPGGFRWQDGPAPLAMRAGAWMFIDEANLASTEVLECCNPALDRPDPRLVLTEADGRIVDAAPGFRVFATWNGAAYAGRQALSPAFMDRFKIRIVQAPDEAAYVALGECLVHGHQPVVEVGGVRWRGGVARPSMPELAQLVPQFDRFLVAFARFQAGIAAMADKGELRAGGRIAVTRRAFVDMLDELRRQLLAGNGRPDRQTVIRAAWNALGFTHLERLDPAVERVKAIKLLTACGITADAWELPQ